MAVREATPEEIAALSNPQEVDISGGGSLERFLMGLGRGVTVGATPIPDYMEDTVLERLPRTAGEGIGGEGAAAAALAVLARTRGVRGPAGALGRIAGRAIDAARRRPGRAAGVAATGAAGYAGGAASLPEIWDSPYAEPVGGMVGTLGASAPAGLVRMALTKMGIMDPAISRGGRIVTQELNRHAANPESLNPEVLEGNIANLRDELALTTRTDPGQTLAQTTRDPGLAGVEVDIAGSGRSPSRQALNVVRNQQQGAMTDAAFPRGGNTNQGAAELAISEEFAKAAKAAEDRVTQARSALPEGRIRMSPVIEEANRILANADPAEIARSTMPTAIRHIQRLIQSGALDSTNGEVGIQALLSMRDELNNTLRTSRSSLARERATRMVKAIDESIGASDPHREAFGTLSAAERDLGMVQGNRGRTSAVDQVLNSDTNFQGLVRIAGDRAKATEMARNILEQRMQAAVTNGRGQMNGRALTEFLADPSNRNLAEAAFGKEHVMNLGRLGNLAQRLRVEDIVPPGAATGVRGEIRESARSTERAANTLFPKPLNRLSVHGWVRHIAGEVARRYGVSQTQAVEDLMARSLSDPDFALTLLKRGAGSDADRAGRLVTRMGPRYGLPAGRVYNDDSPEGEFSPGAVVRSLEDAYGQVRDHLAPDR